MSNVRIINFLQHAPPVRRGKGSSGITKSAEYQETVMAMDEGLKVQEYKQNFGLKHPTEARCRTLKEYVAKKKYPLDVYKVHGTVYVVGRGQVA